MLKITSNHLAPLKTRDIPTLIGVGLADLTYIDVTGADAVRFTDVSEQDLGALFMLSSYPKARAGAINIFLVHSIGDPALGFFVLGEAPGIPGVPVLGSTGSGLAVTMAEQCERRRHDSGGPREVVWRQDHQDLASRRNGRGNDHMGCPPGFPGPIGSLRKRGFHIDAAASGTSVTHFVFDGNGFSDTNRTPLYSGIEADAGVDNVVIDSNTFQGGAFGIEALGGNNWQVTHNVFDGFTILSNGDGGAAIVFAPSVYGAGNSILYNQITATVPPGNYSLLSWINEADVPFAGIVVSAQDGILISNNKISINLAIMNNDGRGSAYALIITNDQSGATGNSVGATIRGNVELT
jgi:hypothetical protein